VRNLVNDPSVSAAFGKWAPLLQGTPVLAREEFYWQAGRQSDLGQRSPHKLLRGVVAQLLGRKA
jgi:hypothetical protein